MLTRLAVANYRSLRELVLPLSNLNLVTGPNGSGKSNLYRALRLLAETAFGTATASLAAEGGLDSVLFAGPSRRKGPVNLRLGFGSDTVGYSIDYGLPTPQSEFDRGVAAPGTMFGRDPEIKREAIWHGDHWHDQRAMVDRRGPLVRARDNSGRWQVIEKNLATGDSMLTRPPDPEHGAEVLLLRALIRSWRFYDHFRTDRDAPARRPLVGTRTPVLANDGHDLAAAWRTIVEAGEGQSLADAVDDAFPGAEVAVKKAQNQMELLFHQPGLYRTLTQAEISDGTLRYLLWIAALLTARPPTLMVLNEPETSLHPDLLPALARLMVRSAERTQLWVVSHAPGLIDALRTAEGCQHIELAKEDGETVVPALGQLDTPHWRWPSR